MSADRPIPEEYRYIFEPDALKRLVDAVRAGAITSDEFRRGEQLLLALWEEHGRANEGRMH